MYVVEHVSLTHSLDCSCRREQAVRSATPPHASLPQLARSLVQPRTRPSFRQPLREPQRTEAPRLLPFTACFAVEARADSCRFVDLRDPASSRRCPRYLPERRTPASPDSSADEPLAFEGRAQDAQLGSPPRLLGALQLAARRRRTREPEQNQVERQEIDLAGADADADAGGGRKEAQDAVQAATTEGKHAAALLVPGQLGRAPSFASVGWRQR